MKVLKIAMLAATLLPLASYAALGGAPSTSSFSPTMLRATPQSAAGASTGAANTTATAPYSVRESRDADGVTIREYVLPSHVVFAVTWEGPIRPDMKALLGSYFPNYVTAGESRVRGPGPMIEGNDDFRVESAGRVGHFYGVAYLPRLQPASVRPGNLK
ncbi:DUF2844 domain-containing protein [Paraburkholderia elongata]|uniref:DUF2844 domain-containing protein n=1 Tax=Paraburkholderia elongata TaxID=2675747 RepID=A0A972NVI6_9BURK|nr:DUF2844 domain-containing protein [Paraburkholderia elongata]NPT60603.1 DUF2844 domain-containing protein [Paraburkholderia elongata]